jgi:ABC-type branched-subunit amino acid transport system substrate-binding protein
MNHSPTITAALTLSLTGPFERQGTAAAEGIRLWAEAAGVRLTLADDCGSKDMAVQAYAAWLHGDGPDLLLGPYASGLVRAVAPLARNAGRMLWNHGGSADDLAQPGVVCLAAPASSYFEGVVDQAVAHRVDRLVVVQGAGPFAHAVAGGAVARASAGGLDARTVDAAAVDAEATTGTGTALLVVGRFEHDVAVVRRLRSRRQAPALLGAVAAGIAAFGQELGEAAEGVLGPVQWWPSAKTPEIGPSGVEFAADYQRRTGREPSYPAALAAAAGYLGDTAHRLGVAAEDISRWATSTLLGEFALDATWRQVGHRVTTIRWQDGRMVPISDD